jgi:hypothetical protein
MVFHFHHADESHIKEVLDHCFPLVGHDAGKKEFKKAWINKGRSGAPVKVKTSVPFWVKLHSFNWG